MEKKKKSTKKITISGIPLDATDYTPGKTKFEDLRFRYNIKNHKNYNQKEFAQLLGLTPPKVSDLESGKKNASLNEALAYNAVTGASLEYLLDAPIDRTTKLGLTTKSVYNLQELKELPHTENAFKALNHLLSSPDAVQFLNMLYQLWISPVYNMFNDDISQRSPLEVAESLVAPNSIQLSYAVKCNVERLLLQYIDSHGMYDEKEYKKVTPQEHSNTATDIS